MLSRTPLTKYSTFTLNHVALTGSTMDMTVIFSGRRAGPSLGRYDGPRSPRAPGETEGGPGLFFGGDIDGGGSPPPLQAQLRIEISAL